MATKDQVVERKINAMENLRELFKDGRRLYGLQAHRSTSGMMRIIRLYVVNDEGRIQNVTGWAASALGKTWTDVPHYGIRVNGCGFNAVAHLADMLEPLLDLQIVNESMP